MDHETIESPVEKIIENPLVIILKNIKTQLNVEVAEIQIGDRHYKVDFKPLNMDPSHRLPNVNFGNRIKFQVKNGHLQAWVDAQVSPASFIESVVITYEERDGVYQAKTIDFKPYD